MPYSNQHKLLFIHVPKNAGTSIGHAFNMEHLERHCTVEFYKRRFPQIWKEFYKFCVIRNPWDRFVSCYEYAKMEKSYRHAASGPSRHGKHRDYDILKDKSLEECVDLLETGMLRHQGWKPQSHWVVRDNVFVLDEYIKFEKLGEFYRGVKIPHMNHSTRKDYKPYYTPQTKQRIANFYKKDIERFDYEFGG